MSTQNPDTLPPSDDDPEATRQSSAGAVRSRVLGPYVLRERIGEGGMGEVWRAEQSAPIRRTVAIKLIKAGMDSREVLARFDAERQALALMEHPCIAKVIDAGATEEGRPYFAMEYVHGAPINEYCDKRKLGTRERLELFQLVCQGVQHAHQKSVLHRDLKPSNVLVADVDGRALPKIIDFGVAKATTRRLTENSMFTSVGQLIGTPEYMSPEQAELTKEDVDTRTDVYSLGVILYELLVGALPFELGQFQRAGFEGMLKMLREEDPPKPSTRLSSLGDRGTQIVQSRRTELKRLSQQLRGDLDWIVMRALEKDRNRRYGSPAEFAQDIQRHLDDEPVLAGPPTVGYRASKFVRRHRVGVLVSGAAVLALAAFAATSTIQARTIARERDRATAEAAKAAAMNEFLGETLASADPWAGGDRQITVVQALDAAVEKVDSAFAGQPEVEASMRAALGRTYLGLGRLEPAAAQIERAVQMRLELAGPDDPELGRLRVVEAKLYQDSADYAAQARAASDAVRILGLDPGARLRDLVEARQVLTRALLYEQSYAEAESILTITETLAEGLQGKDRVIAAENFSQRADLRALRDGDSAAADSLSREAFRLAQAADPENPVAAVYMNNAAQYRSNTGDFEGALADFDAALVIQERLFGVDHPSYATCLENRGGVLYQLGRASETLAALEQVYDIRSRNLGPDHIDVVRTRLNMGAVAMLAGDPARALTIFRELEPRLIAARGLDHADVLAVLRNEGVALRRLDRANEARETFGRALEIAQRMYGDEHPQTARIRADYGVTLVDVGRFAEAVPYFVAAFDVFLALQGPESPSTRNAAKNLVDAYEKLGRNADADRYRAYTGD